jgi:dihydrofolate reductase
MGRKTFDSIGHPLPNRLNIVITRRLLNNPQASLSESFENGILWEATLESAMFFADYFSILKGRAETFVIGGSEVYSLFKEHIRKVYLTEVFGKFPKGDAFFQFDFDGRVWKKTQEVDFNPSQLDEFGSRFSVYEKRDFTTRFRYSSDFLTESEKRTEIIEKLKAENHIEKAIEIELRNYEMFDDNLES